jgi:hypothetical protein
MPGDFFPVGIDVTFSLVNAPQGVTVDGEGVVTVAANAALKDDNLITVRAAYRGEAYAAELRIQVNRKWNGEALYLGTIDALPQGPEVVILKGQFAGRRTALQLNYVLAVASGTGWKNWKQGYVYQWTGVTWEERSPADYTELYIRCFKDGLDAPGLAQDMGWFGALFARVLIAQQAFIETLEAQILKINGAVYGGDRFDEKGNVINANKAGWWLGADGILKAFQGIFDNIQLTAKTFEITVNNKGYLPVGFVYFQLKGQPEPQTIFSGTWENISSQFAGLFFRAEGGNAAAFGNDSQDMSVQSHSHSYQRPDRPINLSGDSRFTTGYSGTPDNTSSYGGTETRPVNTTIRVWKRVS